MKTSKRRSVCFFCLAQNFAYTEKVNYKSHSMVKTYTIWTYTIPVMIIIVLLLYVSPNCNTDSEDEMTSCCWILEYTPRRKKFCMAMDQSIYSTQQRNPTPECMVNGTECYDGWVRAIYLFIRIYMFTRLQVSDCLNSQWACPVGGTWRWPDTHDGGSFQPLAVPQGSFHTCKLDQSRWERPSVWAQVSSPQCDPFPVPLPELEPVHSEPAAVANDDKYRTVSHFFDGVLVVLQDLGRHILCIPCSKISSFAW